MISTNNGLNSRRTHVLALLHIIVALICCATLESRAQDSGPGSGPAVEERDHSLSAAAAAERSTESVAEDASMNTTAPPPPPPQRAALRTELPKPPLPPPAPPALVEYDEAAEWEMTYRVKGFLSRHGKTIGAVKEWVGGGCSARILGLQRQQLQKAVALCDGWYFLSVSGTQDDHDSLTDLMAGNGFQCYHAHKRLSASACGSCGERDDSLVAHTGAPETVDLFCGNLFTETRDELMNALDEAPERFNFAVVFFDRARNRGKAPTAFLKFASSEEAEVSDTCGTHSMEFAYSHLLLSFAPFPISFCIDVSLPSSKIDSCFACSHLVLILLLSSPIVISRFCFHLVVVTIRQAVLDNFADSFGMLRSALGADVICTWARRTQ